MEKFCSKHDMYPFRNPFWNFNMGDTKLGSCTFGQTFEGMHTDHLGVQKYIADNVGKHLRDLPRVPGQLTARQAEEVADARLHSLPRAENFVLPSANYYTTSYSFQAKEHSSVLEVRVSCLWPRSGLPVHAACLCPQVAPHVWEGLNDAVTELCITCALACISSI
jgi:hypothetical protein